MDLVVNRNYTAAAAAAAAAGQPQALGDLGPDALVYVSAHNSPSGVPLLLMTAQYSGSLVVHQLEQCFNKVGG